jgi:hypothetical protein
MLSKILGIFYKSDRNTYLMDENVRMSTTDIEKLGNCNIINSTDRFRTGEDDAILTKASKKFGWVIVTKDIRMALRSLEDGVPVIYISDEFNNISYLTAKSHGRNEYESMYNYLHKRFGFNQ